MQIVFFSFRFDHPLRVHLAPEISQQLKRDAIEVALVFIFLEEVI
jgi:hypothetical protein